MFTAARTRITTLRTGAARPGIRSTVTPRSVLNHNLDAPSCRSYISSSTPKRMATVSEQSPATTRTPRPIPLDIPGSAGAEAAHATQGAQSHIHQNIPRGRFQVIEQFGGPVLKILAYTTAATLALHVVYNHLALEEYRISSSKKIQELESEITELKRQSVQHPTGGRGEFI